MYGDYHYAIDKDLNDTEFDEEEDCKILMRIENEDGTLTEPYEVATFHETDGNNPYKLATAMLAVLNNKG